jgi:hypothetical protein
MKAAARAAYKTILGVLRILPYIDLKYVDSLEDFTSVCTAHEMLCSFQEKTQERQRNTH